MFMCNINPTWFLFRRWNRRSFWCWYLAFRHVIIIPLFSGGVLTNL